MLNNNSARCSVQSGSLSGSVPWRAVPPFDFLGGGKAKELSGLRAEGLLQEAWESGSMGPKAIVVGTPRKVSFGVEPWNRRTTGPVWTRWPAGLDGSFISYRPARRARSIAPHYLGNKNNKKNTR